MSTVIIGKDVVVNTVQAAGFDTVTGTFFPGASYNMLGRWESVEITITRKWFTVTSSDATIEERREGPIDWKASTKNMIRSVGSAAIAIGRTNSYIQFFWKDGSGETYTLVGGISEAGYSQNAEAGKDNLEIINIGYGGSILENFLVD